MSLFSKIQLLKDKIDQLQDNDEFPSAVAKILESWEPDLQVNAVDIYQLALAADLPSRQAYGPDGFGDFNVTLFNDSFYNIQAYVMNPHPTEIHDHFFTGAFKVLQGQSFHNKFEFDPDKELEPGVWTGRLERKQSRIIAKGDTVALEKDIIHQLVRIKLKNITLLVARPDREKNYYYLYPKLKIQNFPVDPGLERKVDALVMLKKSSEELFKQELGRFLDELEIKELIHLATRLSARWHRLNPDQAQAFVKDMASEVNERLRPFGLHGVSDENYKYLVKFTRKAALLR